MKKQIMVMALLAGFSLAGVAQAQGMSREQHQAAEEQIKGDHKAAKALCDAMNDNAKDVCEKEAEAKERNAKAELAQQYQPSGKHQREVDEARAKGIYEVAEEKCDDLNGDAKRTCEDQAKAEYKQAKDAIQAREYR